MLTGDFFSIKDLATFQSVDHAIRSIPGFAAYDNEKDHNDVKAALSLYGRFLQYMVFLSPARS